MLVLLFNRFKTLLADLVAHTKLLILEETQQQRSANIASQSLQVIHLLQFKIMIYAFEGLCKPHSGTLFAAFFLRHLRVSHSKTVATLTKVFAACGWPHARQAIFCSASVSDKLTFSMHCDHSIHRAHCECDAGGEGRQVRGGG